jgi:glyoxylase-like metal-dependent hydrolase (beta-lactamase superfamily II)
MAGFNPKVGKPIEIAPALRRIVAPNASPMTFKGTNTYLLGTRDIAVIDPGPPDEDHLNAILNALEGHQRISHILVTHSHIDHSPLAMVLAQFTGSKVYAFGPSKAGRSEIMQHLGDLGGGEGIDETFTPDVTISDGETVAGSDWTLKALHTPGHMGNHLCFAWEETQSVFSGDLVMGWATSMVSPPDGSLSDFMHSLAKLGERSQDQMYYPGHGAQIADPHARVQELLDHRRGREAQILAALDGSIATPQALAAKIYTDVDPALIPAATRNVLAHLIDLTSRRIITHDGKLTADAKFRLT